MNQIIFRHRQTIPKPKKTRKWPFFLLFILFLGGVLWWSGKSENKQKVEVENVPTENVDKGEKEPEPEGTVARHRVAEGDIPADVLTVCGKMNANTIEEFLSAALPVYDFSKIKIGQELRCYFDEKEELQKLEYDRDIEKQIVVEKKDSTFSVREEKIPYQTTTGTVSVKIDEFLYKDALEAGMSEASILEIADIFSFDIDFTTEIQTGDELVAVYEKRSLQGEPAPDGKILAAKFINIGQEYFGYYFEEDGEGSHYDGEGRELLRQFLRAPLSYRQITSGYTGARLHPITKTVSAHYQIDYAAAVGTPVVATARGTVASAGWEGGWGNMLRLRHDNGYTTHYGHLSGFAKGIKAGETVTQGQVIGYVGSTGWSTGPHLDYGMKLNGAPINPLSLKLPKGTPLEGPKKEEFFKIKETYANQLK